MVRLQDVADAAGVSRSLASRALNGVAHARVSETTRAHIVEVAERLAYIPDQRARALRTARSGALALVVPDVSNAVFAELLTGVASVVREHQAAVLLSQIGDGQDLTAIVGRGRVDGVLLQRPETMDDEHLYAVLRAEIPVVTFNSCLSERLGSVILADTEGAAAATEHLIDLGHRRIAFLGGRDLHDASRRRREGFLGCMSRHRLPVQPGHVVEGGWEAADGQQAMTRLLQHPDRPTGVVVASVNAGLGALAAAADLGLSVPSDLSVVAIQDTWFAAVARPSLTVVQMPMREAGRAAAEMLYGAIVGDALENIVVTSRPPTLVQRASTDGIT
ncbi:LacI family DNA-binding transcriptional regulator [uncultured Friedmanniella sp.]|uniref:LacI family DNA-binding transcriptional regulator n=1 Tax=uncultured Friedmanniella sp. TaxID=335381 RepID=UPI0035C9C689